MLSSYKIKKKITIVSSDMSSCCTVVLLRMQHRRSQDPQKDFSRKHLCRFQINEKTALTTMFHYLEMMDYPSIFSHLMGPQTPHWNCEPRSFLLWGDGANHCTSVHRDLHQSKIIRVIGMMLLLMRRRRKRRKVFAEMKVKGSMDRRPRG